MRGEESVRQEPEAAPAGEGPAMMVCPSCERLLPAGSPYCPHCCGVDGRRGATARGAMFGWLFGFLAGGLASAAWSSFVGPEQTTWTPVLTATLGGATVGMIVGMIVNRLR